MSPIGFLIVSAVLGIKADYVPLATGGVEYVVSVEPELLGNLNTQDLTTDFTPGLDIRRIRITLMEPATGQLGPATAASVTTTDPDPTGERMQPVPAAATAPPAVDPFDRRNSVASAPLAASPADSGAAPTASIVASRSADRDRSPDGRRQFGRPRVESPTGNPGAGEPATAASEGFDSGRPNRLATETTLNDTSATTVPPVADVARNAAADAISKTGAAAASVSTKASDLAARARRTFGDAADAAADEAKAVVTARPSLGAGTEIAQRTNDGTGATIRRSDENRFAETDVDDRFGASTNARAREDRLDRPSSTAPLTDAEKPWSWLAFVAILLCLSLGSNVYLAWVAWGFRTRYLMALSRLRSDAAAAVA